MASPANTDSYRQSLLNANTLSASRNHNPVNYFSTVSLRTGAIAGIIGSLTIMLFLAMLTVSATMDLWFAPRFISSALIGESAWTGTFPIILGTVVHLLVGSLYGVIFAFAMPRMPRAFWFVAGIIYGVGLWAIAAYTLPALAQTDMMSDQLYTNALVVSHIVFGITLGIAGSFFGDVQQ
ncbi:MAG: hypothetical protein AAFV98_17840 [Chloroflexota bacterium]